MSGGLGECIYIYIYIYTYIYIYIYCEACNTKCCQMLEGLGSVMRESIGNPGQIGFLRVLGT